MSGLEAWNNWIDSSLESDWILNKKLFLDVFKNIKSWYWENFTDEEMKEIKSIRNVWYKRDFSGKSDDYKKAVLGNRIDKFLFENRNEDYIDIDKSIIRKMDNASTQREFRKIALDLKKKLNVSEFSWERLETIKSEFLKARINSVIPNIEKIINILKAQNTDEDLAQYNNIFEWLNIPVNQNPNIFKTIAFEWNIIQSWNYDEWKEQQMKDYYDKMDFIIEKYGWDKEAAREILVKCYVEWYSKQDLDFWEFCVAVLDELGDNDPGFTKWLMLSVDVEDDNDDDLYWDESENFTEEEKKDIESFVATTWLDKKDLIKRKRRLDILSKKIKNKEKLSDKEQHDYAVLSMLFGTDERWWYIRRSRKLKEIKDQQVTKAREYAPKYRNSSIEYATGNIKDIKPMAIIENNDQIKHYVYWESRKELDVNYINLSRDDKIRLFNKLKEQKEWDIIFSSNEKYFNDDLTIKEDLVNLGWINMESVIERQKEIEHMVNELAVQENLEKHDKNKINEINVRRSCMVCCFRAISNFFDTVNDNWENFAYEFKIKNVNENIKFDWKIITMEWTIWPNKNHVKLYYDTETWELFFDNFLNYDPVNGYQIWKWNWAKKKIETKLPTMEEMENNAKSVNFNLIDNISLNMHQYNRMIWFAMSESIRLNSFRWYIWNNLEVNKLLIQKFNEENILKQDIIYTIYSKFYSQEYLSQQLDSSLPPINEKKKPAQFKLIDLISKSIDSYKWDATQLLRFRNCINKLDNILTTNDEVIKKDDLLRYLFVDNKNTQNDTVDTSKKILNNENKDWSVLNNDNIVTYENYDEMVRYQKYPTEENKQLNYYTFLKLLSRNEWADDIIDLNEFENTLNTIGKIISTSNKLLDKKKWLLWENYNQMVEVWEIPDIISMWKEVSEVVSQSKNEITDLQLDVKMNNIESIT